MATWRQAMDGLSAAVQAAVPVLSPVVAVGIGWPSRQAIQAVTTQQAGAAPGIIAIYDRNEAVDKTRWNRIQVAATTVAPGVAASLNTSVLIGQGSVVLTLSGTPKVSDGLGLLIANGAGSAVTAAYVATTLLTLSQFATAVASAINTGQSTFVASAVGAVITVTSASKEFYNVSANVGNLTTLSTEVGRTERRVQITIYTATQALLEQIGDPVVAAMTDYQSSFGVQLADGTWMRIRIPADRPRLDGILEDYYRRDLYVTAEYGVTKDDIARAVLVPVGQTGTLP